MVHIANESVMENLVAWPNIIGTIAGILVLLSFIPQIMKAYKTKKMLDLSPHLMILIASGMFLWVPQILVPYSKYVKILKYLAISLFAYIITGS